jgi:hypothetical protein
MFRGTRVKPCKSALCAQLRSSVMLQQALQVLAAIFENVKIRDDIFLVA